MPNTTGNTSNNGTSGQSYPLQYGIMYDRYVSLKYRIYKYTNYESK